MKKSIVILSYNEEKELNTFLSNNETHLTVSNVYTDLDDSIIEDVKGILDEDFLAVRELCKECKKKAEKQGGELQFLDMCDWCKANSSCRTRNK